MVIFGTGVVTGGLLVPHAPRLRPAPGPHATSTPHPAAALTPAGLKLDFLRRMQKELDLTPEQHERIDKILSQSQERTRKIIEPLRPQLTEELKHARQQFREELTPQQRGRFDELVRQQQQHQRDQHHGQPARDHPSEEPSAGTNSPPPAKAP